jgi:hypothetical protein
VLKGNELVKTAVEAVVEVLAVAAAVVAVEVGVEAEAEIVEKVERGSEVAKRRGRNEIAVRIRI